MSVDSDKLTMMMSEASGPINFTVFLEMLANKLHGTDPEDVIVDAFKLFDPENTGKIPKVRIKTHVIFTCFKSISRTTLVNFFVHKRIDLPKKNLMV